MTRDLDVVVPGVRLCEADERHVAGPGTYAQHGYIYSSLLGELRLVNTPNNAVSVEVSYLSVFLLIQIINMFKKDTVISASALRKTARNNFLFHLIMLCWKLSLWSVCRWRDVARSLSSPLPATLSPSEYSPSIQGLAR